MGNLLADNAEEDNAEEPESSDSFADLEMEDLDQPIFSEFSSEEDNEPISLSLEELDHIQSEDEDDTLDETGLLGGDDFGLTEESLSDSSDFSLEPGDSLLESEDDEPIALSEDELGNLLSDDAGTEVAAEGFGDLFEDGELPEDSGSMFGENDNFSLPVEQNLGGPDEFGLAEESLPEDFSLEPNDSLMELEGESDNEPIALSDEELGNLLSSDETSSLFDETGSEEDESISLPVHELDEIGAEKAPSALESFKDFELPTNDFDTLETQVSETTPFEAEDEDSNEPIALSGEELDHILTEVPNASEEFPSPDTEIDLDAPLAEQTEEDEPIALSEDELGNLLASENEEAALDSSFDFEPEAAPFEAEEEDANEPIALSNEELDHILTEEPTASEEFPVADTEIDWDAPVAEQTEEDEGPIALSEDELGNLLADAPAGEEREDLNQILGELPPVSDLDAFDSIDDDVSRAEGASDRIVPTLENIDDEEMVIVLDEYADGEETSPIEDLRKTPEQTEAGEVSGETPSKDEMKRIMTYLDELLGNLPDDLIREFSRSDYFELYKKLMKQIGV
ncbi:hypothetical protein LEP1GSC194_2911 [Leptospira alstonii serovar Sichuan str. 79601]|uniref:Uncharacterized protein n=1 Tax=Leptospira alstonii serovar Sichuan str. 79601 TaxID=1218565 RepID=M6D5K8_9LEPT|nr:hypothetical protein LEP1GSC194_2911 [Leptospira alstonii serovar Sichuan str. 79601]